VRRHRSSRGEDRGVGVADAHKDVARRTRSVRGTAMERQLTSLEVAELRAKPNGHAANGANGENGHGTNGANATNGNGANGTNGHKPDLRAGKLYEICLDASPAGGTWFSIADTSVRAGLAVLLFYRFLVLQPLALLRFAWGWNTLWYGRLIGALLTLYLPLLPVLFFGLVIYTRLNEALNPFVKVDWKMAGPGRVFFVRPDSFFASLMWDFYLSISVFSGSFLQYGTDKDGLAHTWYDEICTKEYWFGLLDAAGARRPRCARHDQPGRAARRAPPHPTRLTGLPRRPSLAGSSARGTAPRCATSPSAWRAAAPSSSARSPTRTSASATRCWLAGWTSPATPRWRRRCRPTRSTRASGRCSASSSDR